MLRFAPLSCCCSGDAPGTQRRDTAGPQLASLLCQSEQNELELGPASVMRSSRRRQTQFSCVCGVERPLPLSRRGRLHATSPHRMRPNIRQCQGLPADGDVRRRLLQRADLRGSTRSGRHLCTHCEMRLSMVPARGPLGETTPGGRQGQYYALQLRSTGYRPWRVHWTRMAVARLTCRGRSARARARSREAYPKSTQRGQAAQPRGKIAASFSFKRAGTTCEVGLKKQASRTFCNITLCLRLAPTLFDVREGTPWVYVRHV
jgi:hypothetical protein